MMTAKIAQVDAQLQELTKLRDELNTALENIRAQIWVDDSGSPGAPKPE